MTKIRRKAVDILDALTTNPWTAFPIFIILVYILFWCTFSLGKYPMEWIQAGIDATAGFLNSVLKPEWLRAMLVEGILAGVGGVLVFLPNILILYFILSIMESSGYLGRAAFIMDKVMHRMGLHGKSFIPIIMGFGCNVPAIMACRDLKPKKNRLITTLVIPFMSCSGRLPVYILLVAAFFPEHGPVILLGLYVLGVLLGVILAKLLSMLLSGISLHDTIEIKPYKMPDMSFVGRNTWFQAKEYLQKLAGPILVFSIALWVLGYFPHSGDSSSAFQQKEESYIGHIGKTISPVLEPVGMNWKDGVAILGGIGAKELIVSTLGVMYSDDGTNLQEALHNSHSPAGALAFMVFVLLYLPCIGTFVALKHALDSWGWTIASAMNSIFLAWVCAFCTFHLFSAIL